MIFFGRRSPLSVLACEGSEAARSMPYGRVAWGMGAPLRETAILDVMGSS